MGEFQEGTGDNRVWPPYDFTWNPFSVLRIFVIVSGQIVAGSNNVEDVEKVMADAPMLQQKMKSRHLTMIAVGMDFFRCVSCLISSSPAQVDQLVLACSLAPGQPLLLVAPLDFSSHGF